MYLGAFLAVVTGLGTSNTICLQLGGSIAQHSRRGKAGRILRLTERGGEGEGGWRGCMLDA